MALQPVDCWELDEEPEAEEEALYHVREVIDSLCRALRVTNSRTTSDGLIQLLSQAKYLERGMREAVL